MRPPLAIPVLLLGCLLGGLASSQPVQQWLAETAGSVRRANVEPVRHDGELAAPGIARIKRDPADGPCYREPTASSLPSLDGASAPRPAEAAAAAEAAFAVLDRALQSGAWTDEEAFAFGAQLARMPVVDADHLLGTFFAALNGQCLAVRTTHALF
jgi:septal ring-binding cell division protein DamX